MPQRATSSPAREARASRSVARRSARSRSRCAFAVSIRSGSRRSGRLLRVPAAHLAREHDRRGVVAPGLAEDLLAKRRRARRVTGLVERLGAQGEEAAPLPRRRGRPRGHEARQGRRVDARLERVERDAERAPRDGAALPLQQGKQQVERAGTVAAFEPESAGGEAGRHVEKIVGGDVALEESDGLVAAPRRGERARGEVVEAAVGVPHGGLSLQPVELFEDLRPFSGARGGREVALARHVRVEPSRGEEEEDEEGRGGAAAEGSQPGGHAKARPPRRWRCRWKTLWPASAPSLMTTR